jgi:hypothetical protein
MARAERMVSAVVLGILIVGISRAQQPALARVESESLRLREAVAPPESDVWKEIKAVRERSAGLHAAMRDWVESLLPTSRVALNSQFLFLNAKLNADLQRSKLIDAAGTEDNFKPGFVNRVQLSRPPEDSEKVAVIIGVNVPCGSDDAIYIYDYSQGEPRRVLESHGTRGHDESISDVRFSEHDAIGNQLVLTLRYGVQCGSSWNALSYDLYRLSATANVAAPIVSGTHGIWFGADNPYQLRLGPNELLMEVRDRSIDSGIHNRAHVLHFKAASSAAERIDPVALQPQDFVDEWLTRQWSEMESRSAEGGRDKLKQWHEFLAGDFVAGEFQFVQQCRDKIDQWQVAIDLDWIKGNELPEGLRLYFLVQQSDQYRFKMVGISFNRHEGCPGESQPNLESPTLFPANEKNR